MRRFIGGALAALGAAVLLLTGFMAWLSWVEPHSRGIHPADRGPLALGVLVALLLVGAGAGVLRGGGPS